MALFVLPSCGYQMKCLRPDYPTFSGGDEQIRIVYLGSGGVILVRGADVVVTAPLYSNPTAGELAWQDFVSDHERIDAYLQRYEAELKASKALLVGHGHFDHLMDVPHVARRWTTSATIYGSDTVSDLLAPLSQQLRVQSVEDAARKKAHVDVAPRVRVWPILSEHSPQFPVPRVLMVQLPAVHLWRGEPEGPRQTLPHRAGQWSQGTVLAYVIDFLDDQGGIAFRAYYQDSPTRDPYGFPPRSLLDQKKVDLAILCVAGTGATKEFADHPRPILRWLDPRRVLSVHWEDFLNPRRLLLPAEIAGKATEEEKASAVPTCDPEGWLKRARGALGKGRDKDVILPCPDHYLDLVRTGDTWEQSGPVHGAGQPRFRLIKR